MFLGNFHHNDRNFTFFISYNLREGLVNRWRLVILYCVKQDLWLCWKNEGNPGYFSVFVLLQEKGTMQAPLIVLFHSLYICLSVVLFISRFLTISLFHYFLSLSFLFILFLSLLSLFSLSAHFSFLFPLPSSHFCHSSSFSLPSLLSPLLSTLFPLASFLFLLPALFSFSSTLFLLFSSFFPPPPSPFPLPSFPSPSSYSHTQKNRYGHCETSWPPLLRGRVRIPLGEASKQTTR